MKPLLIYSMMAFLTTFSGSAIPIWQDGWSKKHLWRLLAFSSGVLLGIAFLHLMPEAFTLAGKPAGLAIMITFVFLFAAENVTMVHTCEDYLKPPSSALVPITALVALSIHALIDGMAIGVGMHRNVFLGSVISIGVTLHKFADGLTLISLLRAAGYSKAKEFTLAACLALATPLGAWVSYLGTGQLSDPITGIILGIATGSFVYVGAADLLPRLHEAHDRACLLFFLIGIAAVGSFF